VVNRLSRYGLLLALPFLLLASSTHAQQRERVALHPCVITGAKKGDLTDIEATCTSSALRDTMNLVPSTEVTRFFQDEACATAKDREACIAKLTAPKKPADKDKEFRGSCAKSKNRDACLGRLAAATKATRTLYITLNPYTPKVTRITGLVVDTNGKRVEERTLELPRIPSQAPRDVVRFAVGQVLDQLEISKAPEPEFVPPSLTPQPKEPEPEAAPPVAQPTPSPTPAGQAPFASTTPPPEPPRGRTWKTPAGIAGMAAGAVGLGVAGYFVLSSNSDAKKFTDAYDGKLPAQSELVGLRELRDNVDSKRSTAVISAGAGAALAVGGAILFFIDRPSGGAPAPEPKAGTTRLLVSPNQVGVLVLLP
jgi:hypothetical protein